MNPYRAGTSRGVLLRDFLIFQLKLVIDGVKDLVIVPVSTVVVVLELVFGGAGRGRTFYGLMSACEAFDRWLNLNGAARAAVNHADGLFAGSEPGDDTLIAEIEGLAQGRNARLEAPRSRIHA